MTRCATLLSAALTLTTLATTPLAQAAGPYPEAQALDASTFQAYVLDVLAFAEGAQDAPADAQIERPLHGVSHTLQADWSTERVRVYRARLSGAADRAPVASYVVSSLGARLTDPGQWGDVVRAMKAARFPVKALPLVEGGSDDHWVGWGAHRIAYDYLLGSALTDAWASGSNGVAAGGFIADLEEQLRAGARVEIVLTGHGVGAGAAWLLSDALDRHLTTVADGAPLHIRSITFNGGPTMGVEAARDFAERIATPDAAGRWRMQAYSFTRAGDIMTTAGLSGGRPLQPALWAPGGSMTANAYGGPARGVDLGHCTHHELPSRSRLRLFENHHLPFMRADLEARDTWRAAAECMAQPGAGPNAPGFKTFWGPAPGEVPEGAGPAPDREMVALGQTIAFRSTQGAYFKTGRGGRIKADGREIDDKTRFALLDEAGQATGGLRYGAMVTVFDTDDRYVELDDESRLKADARALDEARQFRVMHPARADASGPVPCGGRVALELLGRFVTVEDNQDVAVTGDALGEPSTLVVECASP